MADTYWIIDYKMKLLSDFHVGSGATLFGGNVHGLRIDTSGFPGVGDTEIRGLLRQGGWKLRNWRRTKAADDLYIRNFGARERNRERQVLWSYTSSRFDCWIYNDASTAGVLGKQSHVRIGGAGTTENLFANQKAGPTDDENFSCLHGRIYSITPAEERDVGFLVACMRVEDRFGHRRSRGYGKMRWEASRIRKYGPGKDPVEVDITLDTWLQQVMPETVEG